MGWNDWNRNSFPTSARQMAYLEEKKKEKEAKEQAIKKQEEYDK